MSDKYAALKQAAEKAIFENGDIWWDQEQLTRYPDAMEICESDADFIEQASPATMLSLLAEREADKELIGLQRDKIKRLESDLWDEQQLRKVHSQKSFDLENENRDLKQRNDKDFIWRGEEICRLNDELDALKEKCAAAGITLETGERS